MYYIVPVSKKVSRNQKSVSVRGTIADKYRNRIRRCKRILKGGTDETNDTGGESSSKSIYLLSRLFINSIFNSMYFYRHVFSVDLSKEVQVSVN